MSVKTKSGRTLSKADVDRLAAKAEAGFDLSGWKRRRGRPALQAGATKHAPRISVRLPEPLHRRVALRAEQEGRAVSNVVRELLTGYAGKGASVVHGAKTAPSGAHAHAARGVMRAATASKTGKVASEGARSKPKK